MKLNQYWFKPKKYGYGATPSSWEGWTLIILYFLFIIFITFFYTINITIYLILLTTFSLILVLLSYYKTQGTWRWRWGNQ